MKKIISILLLSIFLTQTSSVYAVEAVRTGLMTTQKEGTSTTSARQALKTQNDEARITDLKQRAKTEIARRINFLNELSGKILEIKKISDADKASLNAQIKTQIDGLTALQAKIEADTDLTTLKEDVKSIVNGYYIFAFFRVKISLLVAAERLLTASNNMNTVYTKLQTRVAEQKTQGKDVASLETLLANMLSKITDAKLQYQTSLTQLNNLEAQGFPANKTTLTDSKAKLKIGSDDLRKAYEDAIKIRQGLLDVAGNVKLKNGSGSAAKTLDLK